MQNKTASVHPVVCRRRDQDVRAEPAAGGYRLSLPRAVCNACSGLTQALDQDFFQSVSAFGGV
jgi:hypothetical protein